jgi:transposase
LALVALSVVEQRLDAVRAVLSGAKVTEVAAAAGVSRQSVHSWITRYLAEGLSGLADKSHRPGFCPHQMAGEAEVVVAEMRRQHPRWGAKRIRLELLRSLSDGLVVPSERTINRIFARQGLVVPRPRKRPRDSYRRWQRAAPMQLWQIDIVGGVMIADQRTDELREAKIVTGVDDHSRFCVIAPAPTLAPHRVDRRVSSRGSISIAGQKIQVGIGHAGRTVTVEEADTTFRVFVGDQLLTEVPRTTRKQIARFKAREPEPPRPSRKQRAREEAAATQAR